MNAIPLPDDFFSAAPWWVHTSILVATTMIAFVVFAGICVYGDRGIDRGWVHSVRENFTTSACFAWFTGSLVTLSCIFAMALSAQGNQVLQIQHGAKNLGFALSEGSALKILKAHDGAEVVAVLANTPSGSPKEPVTFYWEKDTLMASNSPEATE